MSAPPRSITKPPFWTTTWHRLVADWEERRWLLDTAARYLQFASERSDEAHKAAWILSARRLLLLYDEHTSHQFTLALGELARYGGLLERFAQGSMQHESAVTDRSCAADAGQAPATSRDFAGATNLSIRASNFGGPAADNSFARSARTHGPGLDAEKDGGGR